MERVWAEVQKPELLHFVAHPILKFHPVNPDQFPPRWHQGDYVVSMFWRGICPIGRQTISISHPRAPEGTRIIRDNGHSALIKRWDHLITLQADGSGTRYTDRVVIEAGLLTRPVTMFAKSFYTHRQRRWRLLVDSGFSYATG
ncbi:hypothetical protein [Tateyamaria sp. ANG-S1]|uniref:hypothetical protein n=1 Tax=Tateyamaria sp. ANG-S1 TaxID=1577905 RepID=UPI00126A6967|nr:hypothetical protein [Tateyamaria sp. ANG-S1]